MRDPLATITGKLVRAGLIFRPGGGQALPGLVIERLFPTYVSNMLGKLPDGVVIITGTNGKTTTTKMVASLLEANGKNVLTNPTGSNLVRGIASALSHQASISGNLKYDVAVLEVDEATARRLVAQVAPRWVLGLNASRDQLDRFGEVDVIASYISSAMAAATDGIITNARDSHLVNAAKSAAKKTKTPVWYFGSSAKLASFFPDDYQLAAVKEPKNKSDQKLTLDVELSDFKGQAVAFKINGKKYQAALKVSGQHNYLNGAAALALCRKLLPQADPGELVDQLSRVTLAFGRGEKYRLKSGAVVELVLVKNPASFAQALASYKSSVSNVMIAINDNIADGRDVSWLWDVNLAPLQGHEVWVASGTRAADMALRLSYESVNVHEIEPRVVKALRTLTEKEGRKVILATYTAMLQLYAYLSKNGELAE